MSKDKETYKFVYTQPPISEIAKSYVIEAYTVEEALKMFRLDRGSNNVIHSIRLM